MSKKPIEHLRIFIEVHPNEAIQDLHVSELFTRKEFSSYDPKRPMPKNIQRLEQRLKNMPQLKDDVISSMVHRKYIRMERNPVFSWAEVHEQVLKVVLQFFGNPSYNIEYMERKPVWDRPQQDDDRY